MPIVAAIGSFIAGAAGAVASVAAAVVTTVGAVIGPILATVGSIIGGIVTTIGAVLAPIVNAVGGVLEGISSAISGGIEFVKTNIGQPLNATLKAIKGAVRSVASAVTEPLAPILNPIKDTLTNVYNFVADTKTWINTQLAPIDELVEVMNTISAVYFVKHILDGTTEIGQIIGDVADGSALKTAQAIAVLWRDTVQLGSDIMTNVRDHYTILTDTINDTDERLRKDLDLAIEYAKDTIQGQIDKVTDALEDRISLTDLQIAGVQRRIEDLPFFQRMLIKALD